jgi:predicted aspartyl protease
VVGGMALQGCAKQVPPPSPLAAFQAQRLNWVDRSQPCHMHAFARFDMKIWDGAVFVPVVVNGVPTIGKLDTGSDTSFITPELAAKARIDAAGHAESFRGVGGAFEGTVTHAPSIQIGTVTLTGQIPVHVFPFGGHHGTDFGALVGGDWLESLDYDLDFTNSTIRPYRVENCVGIDPLWRDTYWAVAIKRVAKSMMKTGWSDPWWLQRGAISVPISFPGADLDAAFDTGAHGTILSYSAARSTGISADELDSDKLQTIRGMNGTQTRVRIQRFKDLAIGEDELRNMPFMVSPSFDRRDWPMVLGMDYIGKHHFWLSYSTGSLYTDSGETRRPTPPLDHPHRIAGPEQPDFPKKAIGKTGHVDASCWVEADGRITGCQVTRSTGDTLFSQTVLDWLKGGDAPLMQPAYRNGQPVRQWHDWQVNFTPPVTAPVVKP